MIQITAMNSAKPAVSGMEALAGALGEGQDSLGFEGVLTTQMESVAISGKTAGDALRHAAGKAGGKAAGKILPVGLPDSQELPSGEGEAASIGLSALSAQAAGKKEETAAEISPLTVPDQIPLVVVPLLGAAQPATEMAAAPSGDGLPHAASRASLPQAVVTISSRLPAAVLSQQRAVVLSQLPAGLQAEVPAAMRQEAKAVQPGLPTALPALPVSLPVYLDEAAGEAGQVPQPVALLTLPVRAMAACPLALSGDAIRLRTVVSKTGQAGAETPAAPAVEPASILPAPAEDATFPVLASAAEVPSTVSARQMARIAGLSAKETRDMPQQLPGVAEARQDASGWFGPSAQPQSGAVTPTSQLAPGHAAERPQDFAALVDRLVAAREFAMPAPVYAAITHAEFGEVSLKFDQGDHGLSVAVSSPDPDFARAVQAAAPSDRQAAAHDNRDNGATGNSAAYRQDTLAQSFGSGAQPQSRNADGGDRQGSEVRQFRREAPASSQTETDKPRRDGIFA